ncbi:MAG: ATP-binding protein [Myxococcales bacterium]|nr:ATP-binding protein [Myxococcales bacterium]MCB9706639.1 ATP-binding protein [Myxococcales bacterium]
MPGAPSSSPEERHSVSGASEVVALQVRAREFAAAAGLGRVGQWELAIAVSEAVTNMIKYGGGGELILRRGEHPRPFVEFEARDRGRGIPSISDALVDNISEGEDAREASDPRRRRGLGLGLGAIQRLTDEVEIHSEPGVGTTLRARKWISGSGR